MEKPENKLDEEEDDELIEETQISWSDLIFLPFHPVFKLIVLLAVILKTTMGPIQAVYSTFSCTDLKDSNIYFKILINFIYWYVCDVIYFTDTILHIVHRQVAEKARKREYLPKSAGLLLVDVISVAPMFFLAVREECPPVQIWPNIIGFAEFLVVYRVVEYFSMVSTHSYWKLVTGFIILFIICMNCISCLHILFTAQGLCANCKDGIYDWRRFISLDSYQMDLTYHSLIAHIHGTFYVLSMFIGYDLTMIKPFTVLEYFILCVFLISVLCFNMYIIIPKLFAEAIFTQRNKFTFYTRGHKIIAETKRRNSSKHAHIHVTDFYNLMWRNRNGIINIPQVISELPRSLRIELRQDLVWPLFYHSPTLRKTSAAFQRWLCEYIELNYKLPGDKLFTGPLCVSSMYYLKSGIVQLISADDGVTPFLSLTSGTLFGDINFMIPPVRRNVKVRCLTYCEVLALSRYDILNAMRKYPVDRRNIMQLAKDKIKHARTLHTCKQHVRGLDRTEDEGVAWLRRRWWEISRAIDAWKKRPEDEFKKYELPPEEAVYHCAKYIGQLVLCNEFQLLKKSLFANARFPWVLSSESSFIVVWRFIVWWTVFMVLNTYPFIIAAHYRPIWFKLVASWTDFVYIMDICISAMTSTQSDHNISESFTTVLFMRCKRLKFGLDILATIWFETIAVLLGHPELYYICLSNRLIKVYTMFTGDFINHWHIKEDPIFKTVYRTTLADVFLCYVTFFILPIALEDMPHFLSKYVFFIFDEVPSDVLKDQIHLISNYFEKVIISFVNLVVYNMIVANIMSCLYLKRRDKTNYQRFVTNLKEHYESHKIHQILMKRLDKYLICQWKYFKGMDIINPVSLKEEPFDIFWKIQGEVAEKIISGSKAFAGANPKLVKELASCAKFLIIPESATLLLYGVQPRNASWIIRGSIQYEYHNEDGELQKNVIESGYTIAITPFLLQRPSLAKYTCDTECEIMYINADNFFNVLKRYPDEWSYFKNCIEEFTPRYEHRLHTYLLEHHEYLKKVRKNVFNANRSSTSDIFVELDNTWRYPDSSFMIYWLMFRALIVIISISCAALQGGSGAVIRKLLIVIGSICDCIACIDIFLKLFVAYFNEKGIVVFSKPKCMLNYLTRGFLMDIIGTLPWPEIIRMIMTKHITEDDAMLINTAAKYAHLYIVMDFFNFIADKPSITSIYLLIVKWQLVTILVILGISHWLTSTCVDFTFNSVGVLTHIMHRNECWMPMYYKMTSDLTHYQLHTIFAESINVCQYMLILSYELPAIREYKFADSFMIVLKLQYFAFTYVTCYVLILMMLSRRDSVLIQHGVSQMKKFLAAEGVDKATINNAVAHYSYWWKRSKGIDTDNLMSERIGVIFRQDLCYFFYKKTFWALGTVLNADVSIQMQLSSVGFATYFRSDQHIVREMDVLSHLFIVHRGRVVISKEGEELATLGKGAIFGPLNSTKPRPVRISAKSEGFVDILQIPIEQFNDIINAKIRSSIAKNPQSENDYIAIKVKVHEDPYNTIEYILRGRKTLRLPRTQQLVEAHNNWYSRLLFIAWFLTPSISTVLVLLLGSTPEHVQEKIVWFLLLFDAIHIIHFISEFYTVELYVDKDKLVRKRVSYRLLTYWGFYADLVSLVVPVLSHINGNWLYQLARILRLRLFYEFHVHFCTGFKSRLTPILMKIVIIILSLHCTVCAWMYIACRDSSLPYLAKENSNIYEYLKHPEWVKPEDRKGGCFTTDFKLSTKESHASFIVPEKWENDYIVALSLIIPMFKDFDLLLVVPMNVMQIYCKVCIEYFLKVLRLWIMSMAISAVYTKLRDLYHYDFNVKSLIMYLRQSGISPALLVSVRQYTRQLWRRQRGNWLPALVHQAPMCLREDLFGALYLHHLTIPPVFKSLPDYFTRQLVTRFQRIVLFPGKIIVEEGDIHACLYFIHEGEVEKWTDQGGETKMVALLTTNDFFGVLPVFFETPYTFSYYARTVVDLVFLKYSKWKDLLEAYPDVKETLFTNLEKLKKYHAKGIHRHTTF